MRRSSIVWSALALVAACNSSGQVDLGNFLPPYVVSTASGGGGSAPVGTPLADSLVVAVVFQGQNGSANAPVTSGTIHWAVTSGGGSLGSGGVTTLDNALDTKGSAAVRWVLGPTVGDQTVTATLVIAASQQAPSGSVLTATFHATGLAAPQPQLVITPRSLTLPAGGVGTLVAVTQNVPTGTTVQWQSRSNVATLPPNATGGTIAVTGANAGSTFVVATVGSAKDSVQVTVQAPQTPTLTITPNGLTVTAGQKATFTATTTNAPTGTVVQWQSANPSLATIDAPGTGGTVSVTAVAAGHVYIRAIAGTVRDSVLLNVNPVPVGSVTAVARIINLRVGDTVTVVGTARDAAGNVIPNRQFNYVSSDPSILQINSTTGLALAIAAGNPIVTATNVDDPTLRSATVALTIARPTVLVTPHRVQVPLGGTVQLTSTVTNAAPGVTPLWSSRNQSVAIVDPTTGLVTAKGPDSTYVVASLTGGVADSALIVVPRGGAPVRMTIVPDSLAAGATVKFGASIPYTATLYDASGNVTSIEAGASIGFATDVSSVASVSIAPTDPSTGIVRGVNPGTTYVRAFYVRGTQQTNIFAVSKVTVTP